MVMPIEQNQNVFPQNYELMDLLNLLRKQILTDLNAHHVGVIKEFNPELQTATVQIAYKRTRFEVKEDGTAKAIELDYPLLADVPVIFLYGDQGGVTMPVSDGDPCVLIFNDRSIDGWFEGNIGAAIGIVRFHSISDGFALIGPRNKTQSIPDFDMDRLRFEWNQAVLGLGKDGKVLVKNEDYNLKTTLTNLTTQLKNLTTQLNTLTTKLAAITVIGVTPGGGTSGMPNPTFVTDMGTIGTQISTIGTNIDNIASNEIAGLLE